MVKYKGIVLAGGSGTRLYPSTISISKQSLPIYDKPMIYYPISVLMLAKIREILIISSPRDICTFKDLLGNGDQFGVSFKYAIQPEPGGLAQAFIIGKEFINDDNVCLILGDNIFYGNELSNLMIEATHKPKGATIFGYYVPDPHRFGVVDFDEKGFATSIEEKPQNPKSSYAITGLYFYDNKVVDFASNLSPSARGELEITDINNIYLSNKELRVNLLNRGIAWLDTGTHDSLLEASMYVQTLEKRQGLKIACLEEIAFNNGWINEEQLIHRANIFSKNNYGAYLSKILS